MMRCPSLMLTPESGNPSCEEYHGGDPRDLLVTFRDSQGSS